MAHRPLMALASCVCLVGMTAGNVSSEPLAFARQDYGALFGARSITTADFNRDGWVDFAQTNGIFDSVSVLLSIRGTEFVPSEVVAVGQRPSALVTGDFNRDGIPDLATANADDNSLSILLGSGDGRFVRTDVADHRIVDPRSLLAADWNNDGILDLIVAGYTSRSILVVIGIGNGGFIAGPVHFIRNGYPLQLATADFDHDGYLDIAVVAADGHGLQMLYGERGTGFTVRDLPGSLHQEVLATGDFNADGWADLVTASIAKRTISLFIGGPKRHITHGRKYRLEDSPQALTAADLNQDGSLDLVITNPEPGTIRVLAGDSEHPGRFLPEIELEAGAGVRNVVSGDFNADGRIDMATANERALPLTVLTNVTPFPPAGTTFRRHPLVGPSEYFSQFGNHVFPADFNRDGRLDVAIASSRQEDEPRDLWVLLTGGGLVTLPRLGWYPQSVGVGDVNADGNPDVVYYAADGVYTDLGDGRGRFTAASVTPSPVFAATTNAMAVGDLNRDGRTDMVALTLDPSISWFLQTMISKGDGTFATESLLPLGEGEFEVSITIADLNRDGIPDVAVLATILGEADFLKMWTGDGSGGLNGPNVVPLGRLGAESINFADIDRDGYVDAVIAANLGVRVLRGGPTGFDTQIHVASNEFSASIPGQSVCSSGSATSTLADIDNNGTLDLIAGGMVLPGDAQGSFGPPTVLDCDAVNEAVGDLNHDGLLDIVYITGNGEVVALLNTRTAAAVPSSLGSHRPAPR